MTKAAKNAENVIKNAPKSVPPIELLAPAGTFERLKTALYFGADAVYLGGKEFSLRAQSENFSEADMRAAVEFTHGAGKKVYAAVNIFAFDADFAPMADYIGLIDSLKFDGVIVSDPGVFALVKKTAPNLPVHISTQANVTNKRAAAFWAERGASRIVLARELSLGQIREIRDFLPSGVQIEAFVHGAMCMAYSGRCFMSAFLTDRSANRGECAQCCRWSYAAVESNRQGEPLTVEGDGRGSYILNSRDLNMLPYIAELADAGVTSFKIEGRTKTAYYVANTVNAYRRALDRYRADPANFVLPPELEREPFKAAHRKYCAGFYLGNAETEFYESSQAESAYKFCAVVKSAGDGGVTVEQRNRFKAGETLEILSPSNLFNKTLIVGKMLNLDGAPVSDAFKVGELLFLETNLPLQSGDILRRSAI
ncbi:MAG: U32 family peptidase [Clostridiales bacterium]|jgi:putative protease|nr:U32 family peptidase [Clostridiales bacterium]